MKKILAIETSCDETALAILEFSDSKFSKIENLEYKIIANSINSQVEIHQKYGGVYPSLAKREHAKNIVPLFEKILKKAKYVFDDEKELNKEKIERCKIILEREPELFEKFEKLIVKINNLNIDLICVTSGPGLEPALWVGINFARAISYYFDIPMLPVNHMEGHIFSIIKESQKIEENIFQFPAISLLISGGHTELVLIENIGKYKIIGKTKDDAVGEAFDKVARILNLPYPGGPHISILANNARNKNTQNNFRLPRPMIKEKNFDFSFSGLKTAVLYLSQKILLEKNIKELDNETKEAIALEFENAVTEVLLLKTKNALLEHNSNTLIIGGGVIANQFIRESFKKIQTNKTKVFFPEKELSTDNAVMIGVAGFIKSFSQNGQVCPEIKAEGNLVLK
ncbi:MAG TPA: tRNA (adenosine(37)-N6)-threonylcarbamoyltransferase complex transferase subunit TsaD [Candidatus Paceibacterota bacterium]|nr:tRNA (adenosine(37)-N6)-threonylcarbamoyltransferase complex transferase subunit TsaD [Candidatus Paceibacterota bacterium]HMP18847.1 tRNA (adenosine(37)-N6)-threonylcarbamoyltransferase complex transferase subunit TsaD [Candidatus Paceibacterota bacterium]HMP85571.1 tRNA (adenosine(37)-N6)-threonylcarbamoyltransferase complex transferase subunit TsaD [Candidatus Paceibacterota bacterium]